MPSSAEYKRIAKQLIREHLATSVGFSYLLSGKDRIAMEIAQLTLYNRMAHKLRKQFSKTCEGVSAQVEEEYAFQRFSHSDNVWVLWFQGEHEAPVCVRTCVRSIRSCLPNKNVIMLDEGNISEYVSLPDYVLEKYRAGIISRTHFSDLMRIVLLTTYGGTWIDATVLLTETPADFYTESPLFLFQTLRPGSCGQRLPISNWFITCQKPSRILILTRELMFSYWKTHDHLVDYFLMHYCIQFASEQYPDEWNSIPPCTNEHPQILLTKLLDPFDPKLWNHIKLLSPIHKTSYKVQEDAEPGSYFEKLLSTSRND